MTVKQAAESLNKTERTIMRWIYTEYIKAYKIGGMWEIAARKSNGLRRESK